MTCRLRRSAELRSVLRCGRKQYVRTTAKTMNDCSAAIHAHLPRTTIAIRRATPVRLTKRHLTRSNPWLFVIEAANHETYLPTFRCEAQAHARLPRPDENCRGPQGTVVATRQGPRPTHTLTSTAKSEHHRHRRG